MCHGKGVSFSFQYVEINIRLCKSSCGTEEEDKTDRNDRNDIINATRTTEVLINKIVGIRISHFSHIYRIFSVNFILTLSYTSGLQKSREDRINAGLKDLQTDAPSCRDARTHSSGIYVTTTS